MVHRNAPLTETGRLRLARCVVDGGWPLPRTAERFQVSHPTAARYRQAGAAGMADRPSRPHASPSRTQARTERQIMCRAWVGGDSAPVVGSIGRGPARRWPTDELERLMTVSEDFTGLTSRFRGELLAHCYRMVGSVDEAEDLVQETFLRAWRSYEGFEGRSSVRTWLYRIATNVCLTAIERRGRRPLPSGLGGPAGDPEAPLEVASEVPWLQPLPDALVAADLEDPAAVTASRAGVRLAFVAALQYLSARQRATLILRDVLEWPAADVAELLGTTTTAINSGLRRARTQLARVMPAEDELAEPDDAVQRAALERFAAAIEHADARAMAELLRADVVLEMPPFLTWFAGRDAVAGFVGSQLLTAPGADRLVPVTANGQAAFAVYRRDERGVYRAHALQVLTLTATGIARIVAFADPGRFTSFGLPPEYPAGPPRRR